MLAFHIFALSVLCLHCWPVNGQGCELEAPYIYIEYSTQSDNETGQVSNELLEDEPQLDINITIINECSPLSEGAKCCSCEEASYYICSSLDEALQITNDRGIEGPPLQQLYMSLGDGANWDLKKAHSLGNFSSFILQGFGSGATIHCSNVAAGIELNGSCYTYFENITVKECGGKTGAITLTNNVNTNITNSLFKDNNGSGLIIDNGRWVNYMHCNFPSFGFTPKLSISNCEFNGNGVRANRAMVKRGGAISFNIRSPAFSNIFINRCKFKSNNAELGGGVYFNAEGTREETHLLCPIVSPFEVSQSSFSYNEAEVHGGAVYFSGFLASFTETNFTNNSAQYTAGGVYQYTNNIPVSSYCYGYSAYYQNCMWNGNFAAGSSAIYLFTPSSLNPIPTSFLDCIFVKNRVKQYIFFGQASCIIYSQNMPISLSGVSISYNMGTGMCIHSATANFSGLITFIENWGFFGGAAFVDRSTLVFQSDHNVTFMNNGAVYGGGIYQNSISASHCIFYFQDSSSSNSSTRVVTFDGNNAISNGDSIFFTEPDSNCFEEINNEEINFLPNVTDQYSSGAFHIKLHSPVLENNTLELLLGQKLVFNVTIMDFFNMSSFAEVNIFLTNVSSSLQQTLHHRINGFRRFSLANGVNYPNIYIQGPRVTSNTLQYKLKIVTLHVQKEIDLLLKECPLGFVYNETNQICQCVTLPDEDDIVTCDTTMGIACIRKGYWLGLVGNRYTTTLCSSGFCTSGTDCIPCGSFDVDDYCLLPATEDEQCIDNRAGILCASCKQNHSFTFGITKCVKDSTCKQGQGIISPLLNIFFLVVTFVLIIFILKFDYKLSSGYIFCFVYYFSIVSHLLPPSAVGNTLLAIVSILESVTQLNPQFLGYLPICFYKNLQSLEQQAFLYVNPIIISILVVATIIILRCCSKRFAFKDNTLIKAICLLLLLSFTAITETSFRIMNGVIFAGSKQVYVTIEPQIKYFNPTKHLPWFIIGLGVIVFLVIPFTLLLLFAPLLTRCFNLNKIKPFLDEFQGCYKDKFRWMAGYYFFWRFIYFWALAVPVTNFVRLQYEIQLISFAVLVIHMLLQPYQSNWLNFADSLLLADLTLLTLLFGQTGNIVFGSSSSSVRQGIVYVLVFIPIFYLIIIIGVTATHRFNINEKRKWKRKHRDLLRPLVPTTNISTRGLSASIDYREPVLGLLESENYEESYYNPTGTTTTTISEEVDVPVGRSVGYSIVESPNSYDSLLKGERSRSVTSQNWQDNDDDIEGDDL